MFRIPTLSTALLLGVLGASALSAQAPAATPSASKPTTTGASAIRAGTYDLEVAFGGGVMQGTLTLTPVGDSLAAKLHVGEHDPQVRRMTRKAAQLVLDAGGEGVALIYDLKFDGDAISGSFEYNGDPGLVTGKRRK